jgi:hypothetical protein
MKEQANALLQSLDVKRDSLRREQDSMNRELEELKKVCRSRLAMLSLKLKKTCEGPERG